MHLSCTPNYNRSILESMPFSHLNDEEFFSVISGTNSIIYDDINDRVKDLSFNPFDFNDNDIAIDSSVDPDLNFFGMQSNQLSSCNYFVEDQFNHKIAKSHNKDNFSLFHINIRSLNRNFEDLQNYLGLLNINFTTIALTETWLKDSQDSSYFAISGYNFEHKNRTNKLGGGVGLFIKSGVSYRIREDLPSMINAESLFIEISTRYGKNIVIGVIYRPPDSNIDHFLTELDSTLSIINKEGKKIWLTGDFNLNLINYNQHSSTNDFISLLFSYSHYPLISKPTRITNHSATLIDNIFTNELETNVKSGILITDISDHFGIFSISNSHSESLSKPSVKLKRKFSEHNISNFSKSLSECNWDSLQQSSSPEESYNSFISTFSLHFNNHFPLKQVKSSPSQPRKAWMSSGLAISCKTKSALYYKYKKSPSDHRFEKYKTYRNKLNVLLRKAKKEYFAAQLKLAKNNLKQTWDVIKQALNKPSHKVSKYPSEFKSDDTTFNNPIKIVNKFNEFYINIGSSLDQQIPTNHPNFKSYLTKCYNSTFTFKPTNEKEIKEIILSLKSKSMSAGHDELPTMLIKRTSNVISAPLTYIINSSLDTGKVPEQLKIAKVVPIFKSGDPSLFSNYRPVSILPVCSKILEKVIYNRLLNYLNEHHILYSKQFGFRNKHSTNHALIQLIDQISNAINDNQFTLGIFLDFSKAFDTVNHKILLAKLEYYGISGLALSWFNSYLTNRKQFTVLTDNVQSDYSNIVCGVPQGSILGPLLFLIYINDLPNNSDILNTIIFADDTNLFHSHHDLNSLINIVNTELEKFSSWFKANRLSLNIKKTHFMIFHSRKKPINHSYPAINISGFTIERVTSTKFLGIILDDHLTWIPHIKHVALKVAKNIGVINKVKHIFPEKLLLSLYYTMVFPYLSYCNIAWASTFSTSLKKLVLLQKRIVRIITLSSYLAHTQPLFDQLKILNIFNINMFQIACFVFEFFGNNLPRCFGSFFTKNALIHNHNTRSNNNLHIHYTRTTFSSFALRFRGPVVWNALPSKLKAPCDKSCFKRMLKQHLLQNSLPIH